MKAKTYVLIHCILWFSLLSKAQDSSIIDMRWANTPRTDSKFYQLLEKFKSGDKDYKSMLYLAIKAKILGNEKDALLIASDVNQNYLNGLPSQNLVGKEYIQFAKLFSILITPKDKLFKTFYCNGKRIDSLLNNVRFSRNYIVEIIEREEIDKVLLNGDGKPNWHNLYKAMANKYKPDLANEIILNSKIKWFDHKEYRDSLIKYYTQKVEKYGLDTAGINKAFVNNFIWEVIFLHSNDAVVLNKASRWMKSIVDGEPTNTTWIDTYANVLYKLGRQNDAIAMEETAISIDGRNIEKGIAVPNSKYHIETLQKMKNNIPTWIDK